MRTIPTLLSLAVFGTLLTGAVTAAAQTSEAAPAAAPAAATAPAAAPVAIKTDAQDRMQQTVCRKDKVIGSLVSTKKTCHTRAQWAYIDDVNQKFSRDLVDDTRTRPGGN